MVRITFVDSVYLIVSIELLIGLYTGTFSCIWVWMCEDVVIGLLIIGHTSYTRKDVEV